MKKYNSYKDSGVEWIGVIPSHWEIKRIKHTTYVKGRIGWKGLRSDEFKEESDSFLLTGTDFKNGRIDWKNCYQIEQERFDEDPFIQLQLNDLLITKDGTIGKIALIDELPKITTLNSGIFVTRPFKGDYLNSFMYWVLTSEIFSSFINYHKSGSTILHLYQNVFEEFGYPIPPISEQQQIVSYLDRKTQKIDSLIQIKEEQIKLLKEKRTALINRAVTKGLDPNVEMKDSGVEWIGEVPRHWAVKQLKYIFSLCKGLTITKENLRESGIYCVNYGEIHSKYGFEVDTNVHPLKYVEEDYLITNPGSLINQGDFVFADTSEDIEGSGNFTYLKSVNPIFAGYHTVIARPIVNVNSRYFAYEFDSNAFRNQIRTKVKGVKVYSITQTILREPFLWVPPIVEQQQIVAYLDHQTNEIDSLISLEQERIGLLKELRQSMISEVVTGKRCVI